MDTLLQWLQNNVPLLLLIGVVLVFILMFVITFLQGRELSFWPLKIGEKPRNKKHLGGNNKEEPFGKIQTKDSQIAWHKLLEIISNAGYNRKFLKTIVNGEYDDDLARDWIIEGQDIEVPEGELEYSIKLDYTGECSVYKHKNYLTLVGYLDGIGIEDKSKRYHWNFNGIGIIHGEYINFYYNLYSNTMATTCGVLFLHIGLAAKELKGFFIAKRALDDDERGQSQRFGFGSAIFERKKKSG